MGGLWSGVEAVDAFVNREVLAEFANIDVREDTMLCVHKGPRQAFETGPSRERLHDAAQISSRPAQSTVSYRRRVGRSKKFGYESFRTDPSD